MQRVPRVLHPEGKTFQKSLSFLQIYKFDEYWVNQTMAFKMKKMGSQEKKVLDMVLFSFVPLYIVCLRQRYPGQGAPDHRAVNARFSGSHGSFAVEIAVTLGYNAGAWLR
jgi:hypothetical protein